MCEFELVDWGGKFALKDSTLDKLKKEDLTTEDLIAEITDEDILRLKLTIGESRKLLRAIQHLRDVGAKADNTDRAAGGAGPTEYATLKSLASSGATDQQTDDKAELAFLKDLLNFKAIKDTVLVKGEKPLFIKDFLFSPLKTSNESSSDDDEEIALTKSKKLVLKHKVKFDEYNLKPEEWAGASFRILQTLIQREGTVNQTVTDYIQYSISVCDYLQTFSHTQVYKFDKNHRKEVAQQSKRWVDINPHLDRLFLHVLPVRRSNPTIPTQPKQKVQRYYDNYGNEICTKFNSQTGCSYSTCKYRHVCCVRGCWSTKHGRVTHPESAAPRYSANKEQEYQ